MSAIYDIQERCFRSTRKRGQVFLQQDMNNRIREINIRHVVARVMPLTISLVATAIVISQKTKRRAKPTGVIMR